MILYPFKVVLWLENLIVAGNFTFLAARNSSPDLYNNAWSLFGIAENRLNL